MAPDIHLVTVYQTESLVEAAVLSRRLLDAGIDNLIDNLINAGHPSELDPGPRRQAVRVRVALERIDDAEVIVAEFLGEEPG